MQRALEAPVSELIPLPGIFEDALIPSGPRFISDIIQEISGINLADDPALQAAADQLTEHIMPSRDIIVITHYFIENLLPRLSPSTGWLVVLLRDLAFANPATHELRDIVRIEYGFFELASLLAFDRVKTAYDCLQNPEVMRYVTLLESDEEWRGFETSPRRFHINLSEPILVRVGPESPDSLHEYRSFMSENEPSDGESEPTGDDDELTDGEFELTDGENEPSNWRKWHTLNLLTSFAKPPLISENNNPQTGQVPENGAKSWSWDIIPVFKRDLKPQKQDELRSSQMSPSRFVSWLIFSVSTSGNGINAPSLLAASKKDVEESPGMDFDHLANLTPTELAYILRQALRRGWITNPIWNAAMKGTTEQKLRQLAGLLGFDV